MTIAANAVAGGKLALSLSWETGPMQRPGIRVGLSRQKGPTGACFLNLDLCLWAGQRHAPVLSRASLSPSTKWVSLTLNIILGWEEEGLRPALLLHCFLEAGFEVSPLRRSTVARVLEAKVFVFFWALFLPHHHLPFPSSPSYQCLPPSSVNFGGLKLKTRSALRAVPLCPAVLPVRNLIHHVDVRALLSAPRLVRIVPRTVTCSPRSSPPGRGGPAGRCRCTPCRRAGRSTPPRSTASRTCRASS